MNIAYPIGALAVFCVAYGLYQIDSPYVTLAVGLVLMLVAYGSTLEKRDGA